MNSQYPSKAAIGVLIALAMGQTRPVPAQPQTSAAPAAGAAQTGRGPKRIAAVLHTTITGLHQTLGRRDV